MSRLILPVQLLAAALALALLWVPLSAQARVANARIDKVSTPVVRMENVRVKLDWADGATSGTLDVWATRVDAPDLNYHYRDMYWQCKLQRIARQGWTCDGQLRSGKDKAMRLAVQFDAVSTTAALSRGSTRIKLDRNAASPDVTGFDLTKVPLAWAQALLTKAWPEARLTSGEFDGRLLIHAGAKRPLRIAGPLTVRGLGIETADATTAGENLGGRFKIDYRTTPALSLLSVDGDLKGGEFLSGNTYVALPSTPIGVRIDAMQRASAGWEIPRIEWRDGDVLTADGSAIFGADASLAKLDLDIRSANMTPLRERYLSGWLGLFGLGELGMTGAMDLRLKARDGVVSQIDALLRNVNLGDPNERFVFNGLQGDVRFSAGEPVRSQLRWNSGKLYGLDFDASSLPFESEKGLLRFREDAVVPVMGGRMTFRNLVIRPPLGEAGADIRFALVLEDIDFGRISTALGLPAFKGRLSGTIPNAHYANERVDFDGGLSMELFDGRVAFSSLALERPFGSAPSLSADITVDDLDLLRLTEILDFGSITGRIDGHINGLRLVDWTPVAFDAAFITDKKPGTKQRISQRAVQNISSVGDASFVSSLQGKLIGLFDDFGYRRIGIACRLVNEVCEMSGIQDSDPGQGGNSFTIVAGAGLPRLTVVGFNRQVDWPTLVERLAAVGSGEVKPIVE
ncbi:MAG: YdbH domain-containing protein [Pseudomonadota bacterium]|nr:YdbH domain-containing protein [Pseudomonadota bacterium]MDQ3160448.1 YdbH domain-containing protein [Pseudomonadota bacterium]